MDLYINTAISGLEEDNCNYSLTIPLSLMITTMQIAPIVNNYVGVKILTYLAVGLTIKKIIFSLWLLKNGMELLKNIPFNHHLSILFLIKELSRLIIFNSIMTKLIALKLIGIMTDLRESELKFWKANLKTIILNPTYLQSTNKRNNSFMLNQNRINSKRSMKIKIIKIKVVKIETNMKI